MFALERCTLFTIGFRTLGFGFILGILLGWIRKWCSGGFLVRVFVCTLFIQTGVNHTTQPVTQTVTGYAVLILEVLTQS